MKAASAAASDVLHRSQLVRISSAMISAQKLPG
jgi:hypothetical protein